jgi:ABC-type nitrate/sulfonate/bicarbonate transport system substrate-binding protein
VLDKNGLSKIVVVGVTLTIILVAAIGIYWWSTLEQQPSELTKVTYMLGWKHTLENYAGFYTAMYKGWYEDVGIELEMVEGLGCLQAAQVLGAGQVDFAELSGQALLVSVATGMDLKAVSQGYQTNPTTFFTLDPSIKTPKDWEGKRVGIKPEASTYMDYQAVCTNAGVDRSKIEEINTNYAQYVTLASGQIDVSAGTFIQNMIPLLDIGYPNGTKSWYIRTIDYGVNSYGAGTISARSDWLKDPENYDLAKRFIQATQKGFEYAYKHMGESLDIFMHYFPDRNRDYEYRLASVAITQCQNISVIWEHGYGWMQESIWEETEAMMYEVGFITEHLNVTEGSCWTNELLKTPTN